MDQTILQGKSARCWTERANENGDNTYRKKEKKQTDQEKIIGTIKA